MLASGLGIRLLIWLGKVVPTPLPYGMHRALQSVEVTCDAWEGDGFQITFVLTKAQPAEFDLLSGRTLSPFTRVIIGVVMGAVPEVLIDGVITHHQFDPSNDSGRTTLTVTGKDLGVLLDLTEKTKKYDNQPDFVIVPQVLSAYAPYGLIPTVAPTTDVPLVVTRTPWQHETDLRFLQRMARRNGYVFYIEPLVFGTNKAYFGPDVRLTVPQPALTMNLGAANNVDAIHFSHDAYLPAQAEGRFLVPGSPQSLPIPPVPLLRIPPLALSPTPAKRTIVLRDVANKNPTQATLARQSAMMEGRDPVSGEGQIDATRYGRVLRTRRLVGVRGAGATYDGFYWVKRVTHKIEDGKYTQGFTLSREGVGTLTPVVVP